MWVPIVGPFIGGIIGVLVSDLFIGDVLHGSEIAKCDRAHGYGRTACHCGTMIAVSEEGV
jgi:glycerol uptake facilitator protein